MRIKSLVILVFLAGCASLTDNHHQSADQIARDKPAEPEIKDAFAVVENDDAEEFPDHNETDEPPPPVGEADQPKSSTPSFEYHLIPAKPNQLTEKWIEYYSKKDRERFQRFLNRGKQYKVVIQQLLVDHGLPPDLYFLGILESGYITEAVSHAGAVGPWQFMRPTGRQYGLTINNFVDERLDPMRATVAAIRYLKELNRIFGSWELALSAYNAGPGRVRRAIRRGGSRDYWDLSRRHWLPRDTRHYVPQFLAILIVGSDPQRYGFEDVVTDPVPPVRLVTVPGPIKLADIAEIGNIPYAKLKKANLHLHKGVTPPDKKQYDIWVPKKHVVKLIANKRHLQNKIVQGLKVRPYVASQRASTYHRVKPGQTLSVIARRYGTSVAELKSLNRLKSSKIRVGENLKVGGTKKVTRLAAASSPTVKRIRYRIRRGDNLTLLAKRFNTTVKKIKRVNKLQGNRIHRGQYLVIADNRN